MSDDQQPQEGTAVDVPPAAQTAKCLRPGCGRKQYVRGLCVGCYNTARKIIKGGLTTWTKLMAKGKCLGQQKRIVKPGKVQQWLLGPKDS